MPAKLATIPKKVFNKWRMITDLKQNLANATVRLPERIVLPRHADTAHDIVVICFYAEGAKCTSWSLMFATPLTK